MDDLNDKENKGIIASYIILYLWCIPNIVLCIQNVKAARDVLNTDGIVTLYFLVPAETKYFGKELVSFLMMASGTWVS